MVGGLTRIITHEMFVFVLYLVSAESVAKGTLALSLLPVIIMGYVASSLSPFMSLRGLFSTNQRLSQPVQFQSRSLRYHSPRLCRIAVL